MIEMLSNIYPVRIADATSGLSNKFDKYERGDRLAFHIDSDEYFNHLAALLGSIEETLATSDHSQELTCIQLEAIRTVRYDLRYLHFKYKIEPRQ